jgi:hypothetical protein
LSDTIIRKQTKHLVHLEIDAEPKEIIGDRAYASSYGPQPVTLPS